MVDRTIELRGRGARGALGINFDIAPTPGQFLQKAAGSDDRKFVTVVAPTPANAVAATTLAGSTGASLVGIGSLKAGSPTINLDQFASERVSAFRFGAKGDGVTDDAPAIQAMVDWLGSRGGGIAYLPRPSAFWLIKSGIKLPSNVCIEGPKPVNYPYQAGDPIGGALVADFSNYAQWMIEPKTTTGGATYGYNSWVKDDLPDGVTYNCGVRNLLVAGKDGSPVPFGGIRMHGCPGSYITDVGYYNVGHPCVINFCFGGKYKIHALALYSGFVLWGDANANVCEYYVTQQAVNNVRPATIPANYMLSFMSDRSTDLTSTYGLATNAHYNRPFGLIVGSTTSNSVGNEFSGVVENFKGGTLLLNSVANIFKRFYFESSPNEMPNVIVASQASFNAGSFHAFNSTTGILFDLGFACGGDIFATGSVDVANFGTVSTAVNGASIRLHHVQQRLLGKAPQFNIAYPSHDGAWIALPFQNGAANLGDPNEDAGYMIDRINRVHLKGASKTTPNGVFATLPPGFRPFKRRSFSTTGGSFNIEPNGNLVLTGGGPTILLDGASWDAG